MTSLIKQWGEIEASRLFVKGLKTILSLLMGVILLSLLAGIAKTAWDLRLFWREGPEVVLRHTIINALILLAVVEVYRTILSYFIEGRVKVTFIVDTVLVVMLTEVISLWFKGGTWETFGSIAVLILSLGVMRVMAIRYSPMLKHDG